MGTGYERAAIALRSICEIYDAPYDDDHQRAEDIGRSLQENVLPEIEGKTGKDMACFERQGFKPAEAENGRIFGFHTFDDSRRPWLSLVHMKVGYTTYRHRHTGPSTVHVISGELEVNRFERLATGALRLTSKKIFLPGTTCSIGINEIHHFVCAAESSCLYLSGFPSPCRTLAFLDGDKTEKYAGGGVYDTFIFLPQNDVEIGPDGPVVPGRRVANDEAQTDRLGPRELRRDRESEESRVSLESRVARMETEFEYVRKDLDEIKADQKTILGMLTDLRVEISKLPTSQSLFFNNITISVLAFAIVAVFIGVLTYVGALPK